MHTLQRKILRRNRVKIVNDLEPRDVLGGLFEDDILTENDCEEISHGKTRRERCQTLLSLLQTRGPAAYGSFRNALSGSQYVNLQSILDSIARDSTSAENMEKDDTYQRQQSARCQRCSDVLPREIKNQELLYALTNNCCLLYENVEPNDILDHLYQEYLLSDDDVELIKVAKTRRERCIVMFQKLAESASTTLFPLLRNSLNKKYKYISNALQSKTCNTPAEEQINSQSVIDKEVERLDVQSSVETVECDSETNLEVPFEEVQVHYITESDSETDLNEQINNALTIVSKTKNPKYFTLELFTAKTRMYILQKKLKKLQNTLDEANMLIVSDKVGCTGRAAGWHYLNEARKITVQLTMFNVRNRNFAHTYLKLQYFSKENFHKAIMNFQQDGGKDGPFGVGYAVCRLVILLLQCGDNGLTMDVLCPTDEDIKLAGGYLKQLQDSDIPIPKILDVHLLLAKCDYEYRRKNIVYALENAQAAYDLATENTMEFTEHAHNRVMFLKTKAPFVIGGVGDIEEATKVLFHDESSSNV